MATASASVKCEYGDITECPIFTESFKDPKCLPCIHTFCFNCLEKYVQDKPVDQLQCPVCRQKFSIPEQGLDKLPNNFFIQSLIDQQQEQLVEEKRESNCDLCLDMDQDSDITASSFCIECDQNLCKPCCFRHGKQKFAKSHSVIEISEVNVNMKQSSQVSWCEEHCDKCLDLFCEDCKMPVCIECFAFDHRGHKCVSLVQASKEFRTKFTVDMSKLCVYIEINDHELRRMESNQEDLLKQIESCEKEAVEYCSSLKKLIDEQQDKILKKLEDVKNNRVKAVETRREEIERQRVICESLVKYIEELVNKGSPYDISCNVSDLLERVQVVLSSEISFKKGKLDLLQLKYKTSKQADTNTFNRMFEQLFSNYNLSVEALPFEDYIVLPGLNADNGMKQNIYLIHQP